MNILDPLEPAYNENGRIIDFVTGDLLADRPEERVRQRLQRLLRLQYNYPKMRLARELPIYYGGKEVRNPAILQRHLDRLDHLRIAVCRRCAHAPDPDG